MSLKYGTGAAPPLTALGNFSFRNSTTSSLSTVADRCLKHPRKLSDNSSGNNVAQIA
jgi:hypothetical protein